MLRGLSASLHSLLLHVHLEVSAGLHLLSPSSYLSCLLFHAHLPCGKEFHICKANLQILPNAPRFFFFRILLLSMHAYMRII